MFKLPHLKGLPYATTTRSLATGIDKRTSKQHAGRSQSGPYHVNVSSRSRHNQTIVADVIRTKSQLKRELTSEGTHCEVLSFISG